jgi:hypothetical protein
MNPKNKKCQSTSAPFILVNYFLLYSINWILKPSRGLQSTIVRKKRQTFGFPQGAAIGHRKGFSFTIGEMRESFRIDKSNSGIGDVRLTAEFQLYRDEGESSHTLALRASVKVPTGDSNERHGSGSTDLALCSREVMDGRQKLASGKSLAEGEFWE